MSIVDLHPEELIDKLAQGRISETESARLEAHLATCSACRFELDVRRDLAGADRDARASAPVIVPDGLYGRSAPPPAVVSEFTEMAPSTTRGRVAPVRVKRRPIWALAMAAALVGGVSFAAMAPNLRTLVRQPTRLLSFVRTSGAPTPPKAPSGVASPIQVSPPVTEERRAEQPAAVQLGDLPLVGDSTARPADSRVPERTARTPAALFRAANEARRGGDDAKAVSLYRALENEFPSSAEARLSHATLGRLMLDRGDPRAALGDFDEYLSKGGTALGEEALVGRALAFGKLGDRASEVAAWREVLHRFPKSIHARLARSRLSALDEQ